MTTPYLFPHCGLSLGTFRKRPQIHASKIRCTLKHGRKQSGPREIGDSWKSSYLLENRIRQSWAKFDNHRSVASSNFFGMNDLVDAVGIEPTTCRLRADD